jgi:hypothetical protein
VPRRIPCVGCLRAKIRDPSHRCRNRRSSKGRIQKSCVLCAAKKRKCIRVSVPFLRVAASLAAFCRCSVCLWFSLRILSVLWLHLADFDWIGPSFDDFKLDLAFRFGFWGHVISSLADLLTVCRCRRGRCAACVRFSCNATIFFDTRVQQLSYNVLQALDAQAAPAAPAPTQL